MSQSMKRVAMATLAALAATSWTVAFAADANTENFFDENKDIVVTGTRVAEPLSQVPAQMYVIPGKELEDRHVTNMSEALRNVPGVVQQVYAPVGYESSNGLRINGSANVQYLVDGVNVSLPNIGYFAPLTAFQNTDGIERVEVLKGAASSLYGSNAVGGVINVIPSKPQEGVKTTIRTLFGSYNQEQYRLSNEGREGSLYWRASYQKDHMGDFKDGHGNKIPQNNQSHTTSFMIGDEIDSHNDVRLAYDSYRANVKYWDPYRFTDPVTWANIPGVNGGHRKYDGFRAIWDNKINDNWKHSFHVGRNEYASSGDIDLKVRGIQVGDQVTYQKGAHTVVGGFDWEQYKAMTVDNHKVTNSAYYLQDAYKVARKWTLTPGIRIDHHSAFGSHTSPHMSVGYNVNEKTNVYVAYNSFFVAPTPYQLYAPFYGNSGLNPEKGYEWTTGVHHAWNDSLRGNMSVFARKTTDKIGYDNAYRYINVNEEKAYGFTADVEKQISKDWSTRLAYTYTNVRANGQYAKANINGFVPKHEIVTGVDYKHNKWDAHFDMRIAMQRRGSAENYFPRNSYAIANLSANYQAAKDVKVFGAVNNLFDTFYAENTIKPGDWYTMPGRNYRFGVELSF